MRTLSGSGRVVPSLAVLAATVLAAAAENRDGPPAPVASRSEKGANHRSGAPGCGLVAPLVQQPDLLRTPTAFGKSVVAGIQPLRVVNQFNVVRRSDGSGGIDEALIPLLMRDLNHGFRDTPFVFVREPGVHYIDNDEFYAGFPNILDQIDLVNTHFRNGVLSWYLTPSLTGSQFNAGTWVGPPFTSGLRGIVMTFGATGRPGNIVTPTHEVGHIFLLAHPYETVFGVECTSGSNCITAGDRVCDTPASPAVFGQNTLASGEFFAELPGPCAGDPPYAPNTRLYMEAGWAAGHILRDRFTDGQIQTMLSAANGQQRDLFGSTRPEVLVDCNDNATDDLEEIASAPWLDHNRDKVLDACQVFPEPGDLIVAGMSADPFNRPRFYDGQTGAWRGDLWNGMTWTHQLRFGPDGLIYMPTLTVIQRLDVRTGRTQDNFIDGKLEGVGVFVDLLFGPSGEILALDNTTATIRRYSGATGAYLGIFANLGSIGISSPKFMDWGPDGNIYVVANGALGSAVRRIDGTTGADLGAFTPPGLGGLTAGQGLTFRDGVLFVSNGGGNNVLKYSATSGAFQGVLVGPGSGGLSNPHSLRFGPDGDLYVASRGTHSVKRYDGITGAYRGDFVASGSGGSSGTGGLVQPAGLLFCEGPSPVRDLNLAHDVALGVTSLAWEAPARAGAPLLVYDTLGSAAPGDFGSGSGDCIESDGIDTVSEHAIDPSEGGLVYFLVRPENVCGEGSAGTSTSGVRTARGCSIVP